MLGLFRRFAVVSAAVRPAFSGVGCLWCLPGRGCCCAGACPPPPVETCCVCAWPRPLAGACCVGFCTTHGGACGVGLWPRSWWGVLCWCLPAAVVVVGLGCRCLLGGLLLRLCCLLGQGWCCAGAWPTPVGTCRVGACPPFLVERAVLVPPCRGGGKSFGLVVCGVRCRRLFGGLQLRLCCLLGRGWCCAGACPPPCWGLLSLCVPPPPGGACHVGVFEFRFVVL